MSEQIYTYRNHSFNLDQAADYTLLIQIGTASFSYAITGNKQLLAWDTGCSLNELTNPKELFDELSATYKKIVVGLPANGFTLLPNKLFNKDNLPEYARLLDVKPDEKVLAQQLDDKNMIIYKADEQLAAAAQKFGWDNTVYLYKGWITAIAQNNPLATELYIHTEKDHAYFLNFKDGKLRFYNYFEFKNADDLVYYTSLVTNELGLDTQTARLKLSGGINWEDQHRSRLADFYKEVSFNYLLILDLPGEISSQQLLTLAALSLCGSSEVV
jgi:hypothetical protein